MKKIIKIKYAYEGLIYLPIFIAQKLNYFPEGVEIKYGGGDKECIESLLKADSVDESEYCDIAICDPFYHPDFENLKQKSSALKRSNDIKILACLIKNAPMWIYTADDKIKSTIATLDDLVKPDLIDHIRCYQKPNTGYLFGEELQRRFEKKGIKAKPQLKDISFTPKDEQTIDCKEILITANVVKVAKDKKNVIYSYSVKNDRSSVHLRDLFFTGIITSTIYLDDNLEEVMQVLKAIKKGVHTLLDEVNRIESNLNKAELLDLLEGYQHVNGYSAEELDKLFDQVVGILRTSDLYSEDLSFSKSSWDRMSTLRAQGIDGQKKISYNKYADLRPLKLTNNWSNHVNFPFQYYWYRATHNAFFRTLSDFWSFAQKYAIVVLGGLGLAAYNFAQLSPELNANMYLNCGCSLTLLILGGVTIYSYVKKKKYDAKAHDYHGFLSFCEVIVLAVLFGVAHGNFESKHAEKQIEKNTPLIHRSQ